MNTANIFYHANCTDGEVSHWIAKKYMEAIGVACTSYPVRHGDDLEFLDSLGDSTFNFILDFSFSKEIHHQLERICNNFIWLDHHQSAADKHNGWGKRCTSCNGSFSFEAMIKEKSGCGLTFDFFADEFSEYFYHYGWTSEVKRKKVFDVKRILLNDRIRRITNLVEDRDIWKFHFADDSLVMHAFLNAEKLSYERLDYLMTVTENDYLEQWEEAKIRLEYRKELTKKWSEKGIKKKVTLLDGTSFEVMVANVPADFSSDVCAAMYEKNPTLLAMTYVIGEKVYVSLRSKQGVGPSAKNVAEVFGGGGHENAAGFSVSTTEDFFSIFH